MKGIDLIYKNGWILYCPNCFEYVKQSDPQNFSGRKAVVIDDEDCDTCKKKNDEEVKEAQHIMGRLGQPEIKNETT